MKQTITISHPSALRPQFVNLFTAAQGIVNAGKAVCLTLSDPKRSTAQNSRLWALLTDISRQVDWYGERLTKEEWKTVMTAALRKQRAVPGIDGGFVVLSEKTSEMDKSELSELMALIEAFGAQKDVRFSAYE
jgi:hypothetical protein